MNTPRTSPQAFVDRAPKYRNSMRKSGLVKTHAGVIRQDMRKVRKPKFLK